MQIPHMTQGFKQGTFLLSGYPLNHRDTFNVHLYNILFLHTKMFVAQSFCLIQSALRQCLYWFGTLPRKNWIGNLIDWPVQTEAAWWGPPLHLPAWPGSGLQPSAQGSVHLPHLRSNQGSTLHWWLQSAWRSSEKKRGFIINDWSLLTINYWIVVLITH